VDLPRPVALEFLVNRNCKANLPRLRFELIDPRLDSQPDRPISRQEPDISRRAANGSPSADLKSSEGTKVEANHGTVTAFKSHWSQPV
jgi:hypothetical protein